LEIKLTEGKRAEGNRGGLSKFHVERGNIAEVSEVGGTGCGKAGFVSDDRSHGE